ncbi:MAG: fimbrillin family protein [Alistipes sp.]|nr:fimbrillin family protein [Alistipes sp.]
MKKFLFLSLFAAMLAVGCDGPDGLEDNETPGGNGDEQQTEIRLTTGIEMMTRASFPALDTQIAKDEKVAVWVDNSADGSQLYGKNEMTADGAGGLTGDTPMYFPTNGGSVDIYALHTNASIGGSNYPTASMTHTVHTDQRAQADYAASDLLYAVSRNVPKTGNAVPLTFRHLLSKAQVAIVLTDGLTAADIQSVTLCGVRPTASFSLSKGDDPSAVVVAATGQMTQINIGTDVSANFSDAGVKYNDVIVVPQTVDAQVSLLSVRLTNGNELVYKPSSDAVFESGKKYALHMSVGISGIRLSTSVSDWEPGELFPEPEFENRVYIAPSDLSTNGILTSYMATHNEELWIALQAGGTYTLSEPIDFGARSVVIYSVDNERSLQTESDKHAIVVYGNNGTLRTGNSLTLKNLSIDATNLTNPDFATNRVYNGWGLIEGSYDKDALAEASQQGYGPNNFLLNNITLDGCYVKNMHSNLTHHGLYAWVYGDVKVVNSILQLDNDGSYNADASVFGSYGGGLNDAYADVNDTSAVNWRVGAVRDLLVENSTIYNIKENSRNRMIRWNGNNVTHHFVEGTQVSITFNNVTLSQTFTAKEFANGTWNNSDWATITFTNNVYRDCFRIFNKMNVRRCKHEVYNNLGWWTGTVGDGSCDAGDKGDDDLAIEELGGNAAVRWTSFTFGGNVNAQLDFTAADGHGVNFNVSAASATQGDPRWR